MIYGTNGIIVIAIVTASLCLFRCCQRRRLQKRDLTGTIPELSLSLTELSVHTQIICMRMCMCMCMKTIFGVIEFLVRASSTRILRYESGSTWGEGGSGSGAGEVRRGYEVGGR